ncbi:MAG: hypothetical protein A2817_00225 [Candidatus Yanofskybacteria bacterium RIFCSPHIGHO2_01_FULL_39_8b]|uniref:VWFA domain-containing protein n=1 Tax=Candidatus Yanofskybacteria bacterium RIFCSPHIGHO2_01_FULL_39_8b TaxID=1802659 RepID=A0A1F8ED52_9BACT|nr:MAG: hypothetical protein A2817_00225 [Candidatus Yanofskybacteria bacterium RIFCSPHIGHO2_01_FULL_39_8b]
MPSYILDAIHIFYFKAREQIGIILNLDFSQVHYTDIGTSVYIGLVLIFALLARILFPIIAKRKDKFAWESSGEKVAKNDEQGIIFKFFSLVPKVVFSFGVVFTLVAVSNPFLNAVKEENKIMEGRVRTDLRDISGSMTYPFPGTELSKAEVAARNHVDFVKMRQGQNDRVSLWLFASNPYMVEDFIADDEVYYRHVKDAPWVTGYSRDIVSAWFQSSPNNQVIPMERYAFIDGDGGGTDLASALRAIIKQSDHDKIGENRKRSVLIVTDGEPDRYPAAELEGLKKRKIIPYIIFVRSPPPSEFSEDGFSQPQNDSLPAVVKRIGEYGGKYFDAKDQNSLKRAYQEIDKLEKVKFEVKNTFIKVYLFQTFIFIAMLLFLTAIMLGFLAKLFGTYP